MKTIYFSLLIISLLIIFEPFIIILDNSDLASSLEFYLFLFKFILFVIIPILYLIFWKTSLEVGGKIVLLIIASFPTFFLMIICAFGSLCMYSTPNIEFKDKNLTISSTNFDCGALDGDYQKTYFKSFKLFNSINILYEKLDTKEFKKLITQKTKSYDQSN